MQLNTPGQRGYRPTYQSGCACPGCARSNWIVGRVSAECAYCRTALPLAPAPLRHAEGMRYPAWAVRV